MDNQDLPFRIAPGQAGAAVAKQSLMIGANQLDLFTYREPYRLDDPDELASLLVTLEEELGQSVHLPDQPKGVFYLTVFRHQPVGEKAKYTAVLLPEADAAAVSFGIALGVGGPEMAWQLSYRSEMLAFDLTDPDA